MKYTPSASTLARVAISVLALLASMSVIVASANAEGNWKVNGKTLGETETVLLRLQWSLTGTFLVNFTVGGIPITIHCNEGWVHEGRLRWLGLGNGRILTRGNCVTLINGKTSTACQPAESIEFKVNFALFLHEKKSYIRFEPEAGETLGTISLGAECSIGESVVLKGKFVTEGPTLEKETAEQELKVNNSGLFADAVKVGANKATIEFDAKIGLEKPNEGVTWSGIG